MTTIPTPPSTGWATPEHFQAIVKQVLSLLVILGVLQNSDATSLDSQLTACVTAAFLFACNAWQVVAFVRGQFALKQAQAAGSEEPAN